MCNVARGALKIDPRHSSHRNTRVLCQLEQLAQSLVPRAFGNSDVFNRSPTGSQRLDHGDDSMDPVLGSGSGNHTDVGRSIFFPRGIIRGSVFPALLILSWTMTPSNSLFSA